MRSAAMTPQTTPFARLLTPLLALLLGGCELVGDIFTAGMWVGAILVLLVFGGIAYVVLKIFRR